MAEISVSELALAIGSDKEGCGFDRINTKIFRVVFPTDYGTIDRDVTVAEMAALLPRACELAHTDLLGMVAWLNTLVPEGWAPNRHALGDVIARRAVEVEDFAFWSGPAGTHQVEEVMVRADMAPDYSPECERVDPPRKSWEPIQAGDTVWIRADRQSHLPPIKVAA